jgi:hypothetical protein
MTGFWFSRIIRTRRNSKNIYNPSEQKMKKLNIIRERKMKEYETRDKSRSKSKPKVAKPIEVTKKESTKEVKQIRRPQSGAILKHKQLKLKEISIDDKDKSIDRVPIKVNRDEAVIANKNIKNINYTKISNLKRIKAAINTVCLAGEPNRSCREKVLEIIDKCPCENFIILFKANYGRFVKSTLTIGP